MLCAVCGVGLALHAGSAGGDATRSNGCGLHALCAAGNGGCVQCPGPAGRHATCPNGGPGRATHVLEVSEVVEAMQHTLEVADCMLCVLYIVEIMLYVPLICWRPW